MRKKSYQCFIWDFIDVDENPFLAEISKNQSPLRNAYDF
jgi:hypothetical protein